MKRTLTDILLALSIVFTYENHQYGASIAAGLILIAWSIQTIAEEIGKAAGQAYAMWALSQSNQISFENEQQEREI